MDRTTRQVKAQRLSEARGDEVILIHIETYMVLKEELLADPNGRSPEELLIELEEALESGELTQADVIQMLADINRKE